MIGWWNSYIIWPPQGPWRKANLWLFNVNGCHHQTYKCLLAVIKDEPALWLLPSMWLQADSGVLSFFTHQVTQLLWVVGQWWQANIKWRQMFIDTSPSITRLCATSHPQPYVHSVQEHLYSRCAPFYSVIADVQVEQHMWVLCTYVQLLPWIPYCAMYVWVCTTARFVWKSSLKDVASLEQSKALISGVAQPCIPGVKDLC